MLRLKPTLGLSPFPHCERSLSNPHLGSFLSLKICITVLLDLGPLSNSRLLELRLVLELTLVPGGVRVELT